MNVVNQELEAVLATYQGFLKHAEFKAIAEEGLSLIKETGYQKLLVDTSQTRVIQLESQQWIDAEWFPKAVAAGVQYMAFLTPNDFFGKMSVEATNKQAATQGYIDIQYFDNREDAKAWLKSKP